MNQIEKYNKDKYPNDPISNQLDIRDALEIVDKHNEWRRGADTDMVDTTLIGVAIDTCTAWIKAEIQEKGYKQALADRVASKHGTLSDAHMEEKFGSVSKKVDEVFKNETKESLTDWIQEKRRGIKELNESIEYPRPRLEDDSTHYD